MNKTWNIQKEENLTKTHVFKLMDTVGIKATFNQTARIHRKIRRVFKKQTRVADTLGDRKTQRLEQQRKKKNSDLDKRREWNGVVNEWEDFSISDTLAASAKPESSKPIFKKRAKNNTDTEKPQAKQRNMVNEIDFVDVDVASMVTPTKRRVKKPATKSPVKSPATKILNPAQRRMDEAIFTAFSTGDAHNVALVIRQFNDVNFTREIDGTTPLMAAAWCGDGGLCWRLVSMGANPTVLDMNGANARDLALNRGHTAVAERLSAVLVAREETDYVYDIYCLDIKRTGTQTSEANPSRETRMEDAAAGRSITLMEPLRLSRQELAALRGPTAGVEAGSSDSGDELVYDDSDSSDFGDEDEDSNDEDNCRNDYPDEEDDLGGWMPGDRNDSDDEYACAAGGGRRGSESESDEDTTHLRMPLPGGADEFGDVWQRRETDMPRDMDYGGRADNDSD